MYNYNYCLISLKKLPYIKQYMPYNIKINARKLCNNGHTQLQ